MCRRDVVCVSPLQGVSVVARLSRNLEELALVERRLDELPYPNLRLVQASALQCMACWVPLYGTALHGM